MFLGISIGIEGDEMKKVLVVEDDIATMSLIKLILGKNGYEIVCAYNGSEAEKIISEGSFDAALLDMVLPDTTGLMILQEIRKTGKHRHVPIIMVTSLNEEIDTVLGLEMGADDYIHKPFNKRELIARLNVIFRRIEIDENATGKILAFDDIEINTYTHSVYRGDTEINMSPKEYKLLNLLVSNPNRIFSRDELLDRVWDDVVAIETRTVDVHIRKIRVKVEKDAKQPIWIETVRGFGYRFSK